MADEKDLNAVDEAEETSADETAKKAEKSGKDTKDGKSADGKTADGKSAKKKGPGLGKRIAKYFRDLKGEFKKIIWPTVPTVVRNTCVTLVMCAIIGIVTCLIDFGLGALVRLMLQNG